MTDTTALTLTGSFDAPAGVTDFVILTQSDWDRVAALLTDTQRDALAGVKIQPLQVER